MWRFVLTVCLLCVASEATVTCRDKNNGEVDWYILYKAPAQNPLTGLEYLYIDSAGVTKMAPSTENYKSIKDPNGVLANTLRPLFTKIRLMPQNFGFISYSDQPPGSSADVKKFGHSKGVLMVDASGSGVWLLHSTPQFPFRRNPNHFWPDSGMRHAQTFICVTLPYDQFGYIGQHLQYIGAFPFEHDIPDNFHLELRKAVEWEQIQASNNFQPLRSKAGQRFFSIAKQQAQQPKDGDLYVTIAELISSDVEVQTWGCQPQRARSYCIPPRKKVINVKTIKTDLGEWQASVDHSKWCVTKIPNKHWTCIADVNRAESQFLRRGGALCIEDEKIRNYFLQFAGASEECNTPNIMDIDTDCDPNTDF